MLIIDTTLLLVSCGVLILSAVLLIKSLSVMASYLKMSEFVSGFILLALATSVPELLVGISSAMKGIPSISLGTVIGSNIANLTIVIGIPVLLVRGFNIESKKTKIDALMMAGFATLAMVLMLIGKQLSRIDGIILLVAFIIYSIMLYRQRKIFKREYKEDSIKKYKVIKYVLLLVLSLVLLYVSSNYTVDYASKLAFDLKFPPIIIGIFIIALGTSLPELIVGIRAVLSGHTQLSLGNIIGSVIANSTLVLGVTALIHPITSEFLLFITSGVYMIIICVLFATFIESGNRLYWKEGLVMILLYVFFVIMQFYISV